MPEATRAQLARWLDQILETAPDDRRDVARLISDGDSVLFDRLLSLARYAEEEDPFDPLPIKVGDDVGVYRLRTLLGCGGMGTVYIADRHDGVITQQVAIKFSASELPLDFRERFESERQFLANLGHPNVVNFVDAGIHKNRFPYLVMEYVKGLAVDDYVTERRISLSELLRLFRELCSAIAYCHQQLFVHGDIKPGNAIVNDEGALKLLDFGLAQLFGESHKLGKTTLAATPAYAAPEQMQGEPLDARADVYSLGKVFEDLLGRLRQRDRGFAAAQAIAARAAAEDINQRYATAGDLINDIDRLELSQPVAAMGGHWAYRGRLFCRRNWVLLSAATFSGVVLLSALATVFSLYQDSQRDALRANQAVQFLTGLFERASPWDAGEHDPTIAELVDEAAERVDIELQGAPIVRGEMQQLLGRAYSGLGDDERALEFYSAAETTFRDTAPHDLAKLTEIQVQIAVELADQGHKKTSIEMLGASIAKYDELGLSDSALAAKAWLALGDAMYDDTQRADAYRAYLSIHESLRLGNTLDLAAALNGLGASLQHQGDYAEALQLIQRSLRILEQLGYRRAPDGILARDTLAIANWYVGNHDQTRSLHEEALMLAEERLGSEHPALIAPLNNLGHLYQRLGELEAARRLLERATSIGEKNVAPLHFPRIAAEINLAKIDVLQGDPTVGLDRLRHVAERYKQDPDNQVLERLESLQGWALIGVNPRAALAKLEHAELAIGSGVQSATWAINNRHWLAETLHQLDRNTEARHYAELVMAGHAQSVITLPWEEKFSYLLLARIQQSLGETVDESAITDALQELDSALPAEHPSRLLAQQRFAGLQQSD